ncbi:MAG: GGDEF domain-containing protein [Candidatus Pacearchaeota archaeon]|nr:GGDEF domain-containing protein [Candidatus Pacearchaeota archaeon]
MSRKKDEYKSKSKKEEGKEKRFDTLYQLSKELKTEIKKPKPEQKVLEKLFDELYLFATRDHLTGVFNRRILDELLSHEIERAIRHGLPLSVILFDIDNFKTYNDAYGHLQGDMALKKVTKEVQKLTRKEDFVARYGGEEFIIVLPDTKIEKAKEIAERIRKRISEIKIPAVSKNLKKGYDKVTISMGIAQLTKKGIHHMLHIADLALYRAKALGKNRVCAIIE